jgi:predicted site-specific integrase-resolvase
MERLISTAAAAKSVHIDRVTLQEWIRTGRVDPPRVILQNGRAIRLWSAIDIKRLKQIKAKTYRRGRGRKKAES